MSVSTSFSSATQLLLTSTSRALRSEHIAQTRMSVKNLQDEASCSICLELFQDPVSIHCGHSFCWACITQTWEGRTTNFSCPQCRDTVSQQNLRPNWELANITEVAKSLKLDIYPRTRVLPCPAANVTLDPATAHPNLHLSEDQKQARGQLRQRDLPDNPERFDFEPCVLGCEGFTSGRHFWEVEVGQGGVWALGVARASVKRKGPMRGIWGVEKWGGQIRALTTRKVTLLPLRWVPRRVSVHLDYTGGTVAFFDADEGGLMFIFSRASFTGERVHPWLWVVGARSQLSCQQTGGWGGPWLPGTDPGHLHGACGPF
uniref:Uncharacterized protein n=1 Tax=Otus sunia TaxID=257818 RepID=A0A8C8BMI9_9STRI